MKLTKFSAVFLVAFAMFANALAQSSKKLTLDLFLDWEYVVSP